MFIFIGVFFIFLITQGYLILEEETLIILASFIWVDAAGGMIRKVIESELVHKGDVIRSKFFWFLNLKKNLISKLLVVHEARANIYETFIRIYDHLLGSILLNSLLSSLILKNAQNNKTCEQLALSSSSILGEVYLNRRVSNYFSLLQNSGSSIKNIKENSLIECNSLQSGFSLSGLGKGV